MRRLILLQSVLKCTILLRADDSPRPCSPGMGIPGLRLTVATESPFRRFQAGP